MSYVCPEGKSPVAVTQRTAAYGYLTVLSKDLIIISKGLLAPLVLYTVMSTLFLGKYF